MHCLLVSHTHWDREWYRTYQSFRARLVDAIDRVLDLLASDPGYCFVLDGQTIILEDYLEIRPGRREELGKAVQSGRVAIGPWYVQPDSLLPAGETHVRNLLIGRRTGAAVGPVSRVAYTPDSFGHPAQFPQLFRGFDLDGFVYWRGNGDEIERLGANWVWVAPDGTRMLACHLSYGYFAAAGVDGNPERAGEKLEQLARRIARFSDGKHVILMNGSDHRMPDAETGAAAEALARRSGWKVERALLDGYVDRIAREGLPEFAGELVGGRLANLLPGVWSTRTYLKLHNRRCESELCGWAEPWAALGRALGAPDEAPALERAWRSLLPNQAHDSICGCSQDAVHEQMLYRYEMARELATETTARVLERLAGHDLERTASWSDEPELAVFNPSPHTRTDVVRFALDPWPGMLMGVTETPGVHPLLAANGADAGFAIDGEDVRFVRSHTPGRPRPGEGPVYDLEFVARDVPALGWKRVRLSRTAARAEDQCDGGAEIAAGDVSVRARDDGALDMRIGARQYPGLLGLEDTGDRGDSYDHDPVPGEPCRVTSVSISRRRGAGGIQELEVERRLEVPVSLAGDRERRSQERMELVVTTVARVAPGVPRVDLAVRVDNTARDHRLRLLFPTGSPVDEFTAATTFDVALRRPGRANDEKWCHPAPDTFLQQGFVRANGLTVVAPGLPEAEVMADGTIAITLLRAVGWLSRGTLRTRPQDAGPPVPTPGAQCPGILELNLALLASDDARAASDAELGLRSVTAGSRPLLAAERPLLTLEPRSLVLSALKPAEDGAGLVLRLLNPTDDAQQARVVFGLPVDDAIAVRLDETPNGDHVHLDADTLTLAVPPHALRSVRLSIRGLR